MDAVIYSGSSGRVLNQSQAVHGSMADLSGDDGDSACGYPGDGRFRNRCFTDTAVCFHCWYLHGTAVMVYALAYIARFTQDVRHILTNSVLMAIRHLPKTLLLVVVLAAAVLGCYLFGLGIVFIPAVAALVDSLILESIFVQYMSKEDREKEALRNHPEQYEYYNRKE